MNTREHMECVFRGNPEMPVALLNNILRDICSSFYYYDRAGVRHFDKELVKSLGVNTDEPVNWGGGIDAVVDGDTIEDFDNISIIIDEAAPNGCPTLCGYFQEVLIGLGFKSVEVVTEW